jgi:hypothetical protein
MKKFSIITIAMSLLAAAGQAQSFSLLLEEEVEGNRLKISDFQVENGKVYLNGSFTGSMNIAGETFNASQNFLGAPFVFSANEDLSESWSTYSDISPQSFAYTDVVLPEDGSYLLGIALDTGATFLGITVPEWRRFYFHLERDNQLVSNSYVMKDWAVRGTAADDLRFTGRYYLQETYGSTSLFDQSPDSSVNLALY